MHFDENYRTLPDPQTRGTSGLSGDSRAISRAGETAAGGGNICSPVTHNVVLVEEVGGPGDDTDLSWLLITTLPIETVEDVLRVIDYYVARWTL